jgi:glycogen operon protein
MAPEHWNNRMSRILGAWIGAPGRGGAPLLLLINGRDRDAGFRLPPGRWVCELDSTSPDGRSDWRCGPDGGPTDYDLPARSVVLLRDAAP